MELAQLELDIESEKLIKKALEYSKMNLVDFIKSSCITNAKVILGKKKLTENDLSHVPTIDLLKVEKIIKVKGQKDKIIRTKYFTHPKRAEELTRRAIKAIILHNEKTTEAYQRWAINQTLIQSLTGSRLSVINIILKNYESIIKYHHEKYKVTPYANRKTNSESKEVKINFITLVPNGLFDI